MTGSDPERAQRFYAETYDTVVPDWPGEIDFYRALASEAKAKDRAVLELACGTGRVAIRLARDGMDVVGLDLSPAMLAVARQKSSIVSTVRWVQADMRSFDLGETFGLAVIPGHSFQNILSPADQASCLESIRRHLAPDGLLVVHLDQPELDWLGYVAGEGSGVFETADHFVHPVTRRRIRALQAWSYHPATQSAISHQVWEELGPDGRVLDGIDRGPIQLHVVFRFEMAHLLARTGFSVDAVYGDFYRRELRDDSSDMIWLARPASP